MTSETRWFRNESHTVNGLSCFKLWASKITSGDSRTRNYAGNDVNSKVGIRVWKRDSGGSETEITSGVPVAQIDTSTSDPHPNTKSATWDCPSTVLAATDNIVVRVYTQTGAVWYNTINCIFSTEQLGVTQLGPATWTVYYTYGHRYIVILNQTQYSFYYDGSYNSRIENFTYGAAEVKQPVGDGLTFAI